MQRRNLCAMQRERVQLASGVEHRASSSAMMMTCVGTWPVLTSVLTCADETVLTKGGDERADVQHVDGEYVRATLLRKYRADDVLVCADGNVLTTSDRAC